MTTKTKAKVSSRRELPAAREIDMPPRHQPSKAELEEPIHLPGQSPEDVARIVMQGGAPRREPGDAES